MISQYMTAQEAEDFLEGLTNEDTKVERLPEPWVGNKLTCEGVTIYVEQTTLRGTPRVLVSLEAA